MEHCLASQTVDLGRINFVVFKSFKKNYEILNCHTSFKLCPSYSGSATVFNCNEW